MKKFNLFSGFVFPGKENKRKNALAGSPPLSFNVLLTGSFLLSLLTMSIPLFAEHPAPCSLSDQRDVSGFDQVEISGAFKVVLVQGATEGVKVEAESDVLKNIMTKVEGSTLKIYTDGNIHNSGEIVLTINFKILKSIDCAGSINLTSSGVLKFEKLEIESSGASRTNLELTAADLEIDISGSGNTTIKGSASDVDLDISGSGKYMASELNANNYEIEISGAGIAEVAVAQNLEVAVSGTGTVRYRGEPKITQDISGVGKIEKL